MTDQTQPEEIPASAIPVALFREILIWPLAPRVSPDQAGEDATAAIMTNAARRIVSRSGGVWEAVPDPSAHIPRPPDVDGETAWNAHRYAEGVYFHGFVRRFLFARRAPLAAGESPDMAPFRLFRRTGITSAHVTLGLPEGKSGHQLCLSVERVNLYLFRTGVALLVLEVVAEPSRQPFPLTLADVQTFQDQFRRAYIPYSDSGLPPDLVVRQVIWHETGKDPVPFTVDKAALSSMISQYLVNTNTDSGPEAHLRSPPLFQHWFWLLGGALPLANAIGASAEITAEDGPLWDHVVDERMPIISTISVTPRPGPFGPEPGSRYFLATARSDLVRLCFADGPGPAGSYPYDSSTLTAFETNHAYQAFRHEGTVFLASGFAFVAYGAGGFFDGIAAPVHMRRQYFQLGMLAHLELASLLGFSARISWLVDAFHPARHGPEWFEHRMQAIEHEYLQFLHQFRFTGASNHVQAQAMTDLWRRQLRLPEIARDLHEEITAATEYLYNRAASRMANSTERLSMIGLFGVIASVTIATLSMTLVAERKDAVRLLCDGATWAVNALGRPAGACTPYDQAWWLPEQLALTLILGGCFALMAKFGMVWMRGSKARVLGHTQASAGLPLAARVGPAIRRFAQRGGKPRPGTSSFDFYRRVEQRLLWFGAGFAISGGLLLALSLWLRLEPVTPGF